MFNLEEVLVKSLDISLKQVQNTIKLLDGGSTVPFIARYRKEVTGNLSDIHLREFENKLLYLRDLEDRRQVIISSIKNQNKMTDDLLNKLYSVENKSQLEDIYLPFKPKRQTKGQIAIANGLDKLADILLNEDIDPEIKANDFINENFLNIKDVLDGAKYILMERFSEEADLIFTLRDFVYKRALIESKASNVELVENSKFVGYFDYKENLCTIADHRVLALLRGRKQNFLSLSLSMNKEDIVFCKEQITKFFNLDLSKKTRDWLLDVVDWTWSIKLFSYIENYLFNFIKEKAEISAIEIFSKNLKDLLLQSPAGNKVTIGLDPGFRTGCKFAVVGLNSNVLTTGVFYPLSSDNLKAKVQLNNLCQKYKVELISIGNGTASRETESFIEKFLKEYQLDIVKVIVSEAGASVYSASEVAIEEFSDLDVSVRGAISIARRLQDPLAELVKIDPKSIGVGQYQHDVSQSKLNKSLFNVVEDCVNNVGVDVNTASFSLLSHISGLNQNIAKNIVKFREENGSFKNRQELKKVFRLGEKAFEQSAGFLRIKNGNNPLDNSSVHPESYFVVENIVKKINQNLNDLIGNKEILQSIKLNDYIDDKIGLLTIKDVIKELEKPGLDPREEFKVVKFNDSVHTIDDLKIGFVLEGVVTNVAAFGVFVDIGVHQDGLIHISEISNEFISNPYEVLKTGDIIKVRVLSVDKLRKRIQLSCKFDNNQKIKKSKNPNINNNQKRNMSVLFENAKKLRK